jgi:hypothetical protein
MRKLGDFSIGSIESRVAARARLQDPSRLPFVLVEWVRREGRDSSGGQIGAFAEPTRARTQVSGIADREFLREPSESRDAFIERVTGTLPAVAQFPAVINLFCADEPGDDLEPPAAPVPPALLQ